MLVRSLLIRIIPPIGCLTGLAAILSGCASNPTADSPTPIPTVAVDSITTEEVTNYAKTVMAINQARQIAYTEIQEQTNQEQISQISCTEPDTIKVLQPKIQDIAVNYCNKAKDIVESHNLVIDRFNSITATAQANPDFKNQIHNELIRLQSSN